MSFIDNHRGPFRFYVVRPHKSKPAHYTGEWLKGNVDRDDVATEAQALLTDPRDTIKTVDVWSEREQLFVGSYKQALVPQVVLVATSKETAEVPA